MSRPRNNLDELQRKHALPSTSSPSKPSTPQATSRKGKFKPAKSISDTSTPNVPVRRLPSFSTPGWNKVKPPPLNTADNSISYVNISSTETTPLNPSTSCIPAKRLSSGSFDDLAPPSPPKRSKTSRPPEKENIFHPQSNKGKSRAREPSRPSAKSRAPSPTTATAPHYYTQFQAPSGPITLRAAFETLPHDVDLSQKNEKQLRAACDTAQDLMEAVNKLIGAARTDPLELKDIEFLNILSDYIEKRQAASRAELKAIQRGERPTTTRDGTNTSVVTSSGTIAASSDSNWPSDSIIVDPPPEPVPRSAAFVAESPNPADTVDADEQLWNSFEEDPTGHDPPKISTPATPPATQPRSVPSTRAPSLPTASEPLSEPTLLTQRPYYPQVKKALNETFKLESFRPKQLDAICAAMEGCDVFVLFPTGSGKSLTFQIPAVCQDGVTVVISPLRSLMSDQVDVLLRRDVDVAKISGDMNEIARKEVMKRLTSKDKNKPHLLYVTPEQLQMSNSFRDTLGWLNQRGELMRFVIDEAHCISDWGRRFRISYTQLTELRNAYPEVPISALTATANAEVEQDIISRLGMKNCVRLKLSFNRKNLDYEVRPKKSAKTCLTEIAQYIKVNHQHETGIIYCLSRNNCEEVAKALRDQHGLRAKHYHASMDSRDRERVQREWNRGEVLIIVATIAFGMGIDKPDVRYVIHYTLPSTLANYYQETGRAGRDGGLAKCILYYNYGDAASRIEMIRKEDKPEEEKRWQEEDLLSVVRYCANDVRCRRQQVLAYFSEVFDEADCHGLCNNCRDKTPTETVDHTEDAVKALQLLQSLKGWLTKNMLVSALRGSRVKAMIEKGFDKNPHYGPCKHLSQPIVERIVDEMLINGFLRTTQVQKGEYSQTYLEMGTKADSLRNREMRLHIEFRKDSGKVTARQRKPQGRTAQDSAGPSSASSYRGRKGRTAVIPEEDPAEKLSLFRDDPEDPDFDDIEDVSSPAPPARRIHTRAVPSASQSLAIDSDSDIEEIDSLVMPKVTLIQKEDLPNFAAVDDVEIMCKDELLALRDSMRGSARHLADLFNDEVIDLLSIMLPNDRRALQDALALVDDLAIEHLGEWHKKMLSICTKYHMQRGRTK